MKYLAVKHMGALRPADDLAEQAFAKIKQGATVTIEVKAPRNVRQHRLLFAILKVILDNTELFPDTTTALTALKIGTGHADVIPWVTPDGQSGTAVMPRSIAFENMDGSAFSEWFDRAIRLVSERWLHIAPDALRAEIEEMVK